MVRVAPRALNEEAHVARILVIDDLVVGSCSHGVVKRLDKAESLSKLPYCNSMVKYYINRVDLYKNLDKYIISQYLLLLHT